MKKFKLILCMLLVVAIASAAFIGCATPGKEDVLPVELSQETKLAKENALSLVKWYNVKNGLDENADPLSGAVLEKYSSNSLWLAISLKAIGATANFADYKKVLDNYIDEKAALEEPFENMQATDFQKIALAYYAAGGDPNYVGASKTDIFARATSFERSNAQGLNGLSYGLISLNMASLNKTATAEEFIKSILAYQNASGGFAWFNNPLLPPASDADLTGIVMQALAPYYGDLTSYTYESQEIKDDNGNAKTITKTVKTVIDEMVASLKIQLDKDGNIAGAFGVNPSSTATVIAALSAIGKDVYTDPDFTKKDDEKTVTLFDGLAMFKTEDGGYRYKTNDGAADFFSAKDALLAFSAYYTFGAKQSGVYSELRNASIVNIECKNILANIGDLASGYDKYVPASGILVQQAFVDLPSKNTAENVIKEACNARGIKLDISGGYISGINNLAEKSCGKNSGWLYKVNNTLATTGVSNVKLKSGDILSFHFTVIMGDVK